MVAAKSDMPHTPNIFDHVIGFFTRGNPVVRVGMVVLFFGVSFLIKYAAERNLVPIELRLTGVVLSALAVLTLGWRLRERSGNYGLVLQGGAIGVLYLTVFAAAKLYHLLPPGFAFLVMIALVSLSGILAVMQDSRALAVFGSARGFLAPVLNATGGGSHVMLFSYYALLNAGVLGIAWFRAWRELNVLGFLFTFVIGASWAYKFYRPEYFASTENAETWRTIAWALVPGAVIAALMKWGLALRWPVFKHPFTYLALALAPVALYLFLWELGACLRLGAADPLPYVALLNPLDIAQIFVLLILTRWPWTDLLGSMPP